MSDSITPKGQAGVLVWVAGLAAVLMIASHVAGKATRDALFLTAFDVTLLPRMMLVSAILSVAAVFAMSHLMSKLGPASLVPKLYTASAALFCVQWLAMGVQPELMSIALYIQVSVLNAILISGFWSLINERFDPYTAKRTIARLAAAAAFGGLLGGLTAKLVAAAVDTRAVLLVLGAAHLVSAASLATLARGQPTTEAARPSASFLFAPIKHNPLIRRMAILAVLIATTGALLDYLLKATAAEQLSKEELIGFFSYFYTAVGLGGFLLQSLVGGKALRWLGLGGAMAVWPIVVLAGSTLVLMLKQLLTVTLLRAGASIFYNSFFRAGFEVLYTPIAAADKRATKILIDVGADRSGDMLGSVLVMGILLFPTATDEILLVTALVLGALCLLVVYLIHHGYVTQLADNLRSGALKAEDVVAVDATTRHTLATTQTSLGRNQLLKQIADYQADHKTRAPPVSEHPFAPEPSDPVMATIADLRSDDAERVRRALATQAATAALVPHVLPLLQEPQYVREAFESLRTVASSATGQLVDALLDHRAHPLIRRRIPLLLGRTDNQRALDGLVAALADEDPDVHYRCGEGLKRLKQTYPGLDFRADQVRQELEHALSAMPHRQAGQERLRTQVQAEHHLFNLLGTLYGSVAMELCFQALQSGDATQEGTALEYLDNSLPLDLRNVLWPIITKPGKPAKTDRPPRQMLHELLSASKRREPLPLSSAEATEEERLDTGDLYVVKRSQRRT
ncbi:MAG: hypothetical protein QNK18_06065 [Gammaproteobacteria bacterium]|nr:hypothetical protein [Gammaproteobacteria bacterium]